MGSPKTYSRGRVCAHPTCDTRVNQYNPSAYCYQHEALHRRRFDVEALLFTTKTCGTCGKELPASPDHFRRDADAEGGYKAACKGCERKSRASGGSVSRHAPRRSAAPIDIRGSAERMRVERDARAAARQARLREGS